MAQFGGGMMDAVTLALAKSYADSRCPIERQVMPVREQWDRDRTLLAAGEQTDITLLDDNVRAPDVRFNGHQSVKMTSTNKSDSRVRKHGQFDLSGFSHFEVIYYTDTGQDVYWFQVIYRAELTGKYTRCLVSLSPLSGKSGWRRARISKRSFIKMNGFEEADWSNIITIELGMSSQTDKTAVVYAAALYAMNLPPVVSIEFDDGYKSIYETAYPIMDSLGLVGSANINTGNIGDATRMSWAQLRELQNAGWAVSNHTHNHLSLKTSTEAEIRADLAKSRTIMKRHGFDAGANYLVAPYGNVNTAFWDVYFDYAKVFRTTSGSPFPSQPLGLIPLESTRGYMELGYAGIGYPATLEDVQGIVDELLERQEWAILNFHRIVENPGASTEWSTADFTALMEYIATKRDAGELLVMNAIDVAYQTQGPTIKDNDGHAYIAGVRDGHPVLVDLDGGEE